MAAFCSGDLVNSIVADIGSYATKIGFAGEDYPRSYFRSNVAVLREGEEEGSSLSTTAAADGAASSATEVSTTTSESVTTTSPTRRDRRRQRQHKRNGPRSMIQQVKYDYFHRPICGDNDGNWSVVNPVNSTTGLFYDPIPSRGISGADWSDLIPTFLNHGYETGLGIGVGGGSSSSSSITTSHNPLLLVERSYNPPPIRQQLLEVLMEECQIPAIFFARDATLACYACGRTTSTVIDIGYSGTVVTPVYEGYVEQKGIRRSPIGGKCMDEIALSHLDALVSSLSLTSKKKSSSISSSYVLPLYQVRNPTTTRRHDMFHKLARLEIAKECRFSGAGAAVAAAASKSLHVPSMSFTLPDGQTVDVPSPNRFEVAEFVLGRPEQQSQQQQQQQRQQQDGSGDSNNNSNGNNLLSSSDMQQDQQQQNDMQSSSQQQQSLSSTSSQMDISNDDRSSPEQEEQQQQQQQKLQKQRGHTLSIRRKEYSSLLSMQNNNDTTNDDSEEDEEDNNEEDKEEEEDVDKAAAAKYTEASAVGISSRRTTRNRGAGGPTSSYVSASKRKRTNNSTTTAATNKNKNTTQQQGFNNNDINKTLFSNRILQRACRSYFETHVTEQLTSVPIANMVCDAAIRCDRDQQASLLGNVILGGGGACIGPTDQAVPDQLRDQIETIIHTHTPGWRVKVLSPNIQERAICSWLGGSILGSLGTFHDMWITKQEYDEWGSAIVNRKCP